MRLPGTKRYITARAIIIQDGKMLAFHRKRKDRLTRRWFEYYSIPGGQIDHGESIEEAAVRELNEEMGVDIRIDGQVAHHSSALFEHYVFAAHIVGGSPHFRIDSEEARDYDSVNNQYKVVWVPVRDLSRSNLRYYGVFYDHILALSDGQSPHEVNKMTLP
jgi:ADP-ribose pyrophosphatase YjhB (NUDIX family)